MCDTVPLVPIAAIPIERLFGSVVSPTFIWLFVLDAPTVKLLPPSNTKPLELAPTFIFTSFTFTGTWLSLKNAPTNFSFVPDIFPKMKSLVVSALLATIPFASSSIKFISPLFSSPVSVSAPSLVV